MRLRLLVAGPLAVLASLFLAASAMASIQLTVTTTADENNVANLQCSLREAIGASNTSTTVGTADCPTSGSPSGGNHIGFAAALGANPVVNLDIANPNLSVLNNDVTITGPATVNGATNSGFRVITSTGLNLTLTSLTISNGSENVEGLGGGIRQNGGQLVLNNSTVSGNTTALTSTSSVLASGGGIYSTGKVTLNNSAVTNNHASATLTGGTGSSLVLGGGVEANSADLTMNNSVVSGNQAIASGDGTGVEADGGGVRTNGNVLIEHSTISSNLVSATSTGMSSPQVQGGGMLFHGASSTVDVELSTIANNLMKAPPSTNSASQRGGGIETFSVPTADYVSDTIAGNGLDPASQTAGILGLNFQSAGAGTRSFSNTIIANPVGSVGTNCSGSEPYATGGDPNLEFPVTGTSPSDCFTPATNILVMDPQLGALGNNGGATPTMVPAPTSPVIDQGTASAQNDLTEDQRSLTRPVVFTGLSHSFDGSDIGAVEVQLACAGQATPSTSCAGPPTPAPTPPSTPKKKKCKKKAKKGASSAKKKKCKKKGKK
jgi:CSLREA domain-containing protein